ncbi:MAG: YebC/PmpR family DNA-binding transcriptional regulator [bacterium]|nr:YebC/PmpR family DNA-binding transcriptional regulator [bacterium]
MSGHSRWAQIKHKKAATDAKKGKLFSRLSRLITLAAKELGPDPKTNPRLAAAIDEARKANMPSDNIERAVKRAGEKESANLKEVSYEAHGPGGTALIVNAVTDNPNRTTNEIKRLLTEHGAKLGEMGSAMWAFEKRDGDFIAKFPQTLTGEDSKKFETLLEALSDQDDVEEVYSNAQL